MTDYGNVISSIAGGAQQNAAAGVVGAVADSPDDAQRAFELAQSSGVPADQIYGNLDAFERYYKSAMASQIVQQNPHLQDYANSHVLAPKISNDDWGQLDTVSHSLNWAAGAKSVLQRIIDAQGSVNPFAYTAQGQAIKQQIQKGFMEGFGEGGIGQWLVQTPEDLEWAKQNRLAFAGWSTLGAIPELFFRGFGGLTNAVVQGASEAYAQATGDRDGADKYAEQAIQALTDPGLAASLEGLDPFPLALHNVTLRSMTRVGPYVHAGIEPPRGIDPIIDHIHAAQSKMDVDNLMESLKEAAKSTTRERNPDMFANFVRQHTNLEVGIPNEAVRRLYGDTTPMPDDGMLGWVPGIEDQLVGSDLTGGDIRVPLGDFLAKMDPKVGRELKDDIRVRPNGMTLTEAKDLRPIDLDEDLFDAKQPDAPQNLQEELQARFEDKPAIRRDEPIEIMNSVRDSGGLHPIGDKVALKKVSQGEGRFANVHDFDLLDGEGKRVGDIQLTYDEAKKDLFVEYVRHDQGPGAFGPRAVRDIARQLKVEFPEAQTVSGVRVSGARETVAGAKADAANIPRGWSGWSGEHVSVPLSRSGELISDLAERRGGVTGEGQYITREGLTYEPIKENELTSEQRKVIEDVNAVFDKMAPRLVERRAVKRNRTGGKVLYGTYANYTDRMPIIVWALESPDQVGTARHEIIHHLRRTGFLSQKEWGTLRDAAMEGNWIRKYNIAARYKGQPLGIQLEEAVAEHFGHWYRKEFPRKMPTGISAIFQKISHLYEGIRTAVRERLGKDADWRDLFVRVEKGEIGSRRGVEPIDPREFRGPMYQKGEEQPLGIAHQKEEQLELPGTTRIEDQALFTRDAFRAAKEGMTIKSFRKYMDLMKKQDTEDSAYAKQQNLKEITRRQTEEWKAKEKAIRAEIKPDFENRPDIAADKFLREGVLYGEKVKGRPRLNSEKLTAEQKAALPKDLHAPGGLHPDDVGNLFGYHSGEDMVNDLVQTHRAREAAKLTPQRYVNKLVDLEVERRMRTESGDLAQNILDEAQDHVISQTQFDMLHEDTLRLADQAGMEMSLTKEDVQEMARQGFAKLKVRQVGVQQHLRDALRANELAERALLDGDPKEAFKQKQKQLFSFLYAREAKKLEKEQKKFNRLVKKYTPRQVGSVPAEYTNYIHEIMQRFGIGVNRTPADLATELNAQGYGSLEEFVDHKNGDYGNMALDDRLYDPNFKGQIGNLSVDEFRAVNDALIQLDKAGRDEKKVLREGASEDLSVTTGGMKDELKTFPLKVQTYPRTKIGKYTDLAKRFASIAIINAETWLNRWDRDNPNGWFNQWLVRPMYGSVYRERSLGKEFSRDYKAIGEIKDGNRLVRSPFNDPLTKTDDNPDGIPYAGFSRRHLAVMVNNAGNDYNWGVLTKGHDSTMTREALARLTTKDDWVRAEKIGQVFSKAFEMASTVYRNLYGVAPPKIELTPFRLQWPNGDVFESKGWYYPIIKDADRTNRVRFSNGEDLLDKDRGMYPSIANGYTKRRTGAIDVLSLESDMIVPRLNQIIHDIAFRQEVVEAAKIVKDKDLRTTIRQRYGPQYVDMLDHWLGDIAGGANFQSGTMSLLTRFSNYMRTNMISSLIGFSASTIMKHGPSALVNSAYEAGVKNFSQEFSKTTMPMLYDSVMHLFTGDERSASRDIQFAIDNSELLRSRTPHWEEVVGGAHKIVEGKTSLRDTIVEWGAKGVALSDLLSAVPTWLARYKQAIIDGEDHGNAVFMADRAVRRAHGDVSVANLPEGIRRAGPFGSWFTSLYGFFGTQLQRRVELAFQANDTVKYAKEGDLKSAAKNVPGILGLAFTTLVWTAIVEEAVDSIGTDDRRSWLNRSLSAAFDTIASGIPLVRDFRGLTSGHEPSTGLISTLFHDIGTTASHVAHPVKAFDRAHATKTVADFLSTFGELSGRFPRQAAKVVRFGMGLRQGTERPKGPADVGVGLMRGTTKRRIER